MARFDDDADAAPRVKHAGARHGPPSARRKAPGRKATLEATDAATERAVGFAGSSRAVNADAPTRFRDHETSGTCMRAAGGNCDDAGDDKPVATHSWHSARRAAVVCYGHSEPAARVAADEWSTGSARSAPAAPARGAPSGHDAVGLDGRAVDDQVATVRFRRAQVEQRNRRRTAARDRAHVASAQANRAARALHDARVDAARARAISGPRAAAERAAAAIKLAAATAADAAGQVKRARAHAAHRAADGLLHEAREWPDRDAAERMQGWRAVAHLQDKVRQHLIKAKQLKTQPEFVAWELRAEHEQSKQASAAQAHVAAVDDARARARARAATARAAFAQAAHARRGNEIARRAAQHDSALRAVASARAPAERAIARASSARAKLAAAARMRHTAKYLPATAPR